MTAVKRHAGKIRYVYGPSGRQTLAEGKDLSTVHYIIGTGGALVRLDSGRDILREVIDEDDSQMELLPKGQVKVLIDEHYIIASLGILAYKYEEAALKLLEDSVGFKFPEKKELELDLETNPEQKEE